MMELNVKPEEGTADFDVEHGCPVCDGPLSMRLRAGSSWGYCSACHWIQRKYVEVGNNKISVMHPPGALA